MRNHRTILAKALKNKGHTYKSIAKVMGWTASAVGHKLLGRRDWSEGELARMCELAGMTIIELAALSEDMPVYFRRAGVAEGASILESLNDKQFEAAMHMLRVIQKL